MRAEQQLVWRVKKYDVSVKLEGRELHEVTADRRPPRRPPPPSLCLCRWQRSCRSLYHFSSPLRVQTPPPRRAIVNARALWLPLRPHPCCSPSTLKAASIIRISSALPHVPALVLQLQTYLTRVQRDIAKMHRFQRSDRVPATPPAMPAATTPTAAASEEAADLRRPQARDSARARQTSAAGTRSCEQPDGASTAGKEAEAPSGCSVSACGNDVAMFPRAADTSKSSALLAQLQAAVETIGAAVDAADGPDALGAITAQLQALLSRCGEKQRLLAAPAHVSQQPKAAVAGAGTAPAPSEPSGGLWC